MISQESHIDIDRPADEVYDFVVTNYVQNHARWNQHVSRTDLDGGGPLVVGATGTEILRQMGREMTYRFRVAELTSDHVTLDATSSGTRFGAVWAVTPAGSGSRLSITFHITLEGVLRPFESRMSGGVLGEINEAAERIKQLVEGEA